MKWQPQQAKDNRISSSSSIIDMNNCENLEIRTGVFIIMDRDHDVYYIGKAKGKSLRDEIEKFAIKFAREISPFKIKVLYTDHYNLATTLESDLRDYYSTQIK